MFISKHEIPLFASIKESHGMRKQFHFSQLIIKDKTFGPIMALAMLQ